MRQSPFGTALRWAVVGAAVAASAVFIAGILPAAALGGLAGTLATAGYTTAMAWGAGVLAFLGGVKQTVQNVAHDKQQARSNELKVSYPARGPAPSVQVSAPAQDMGQSQEAAVSFVAREEARRQASPDTGRVV